MINAVIDTNVLVSALITRHRDAATVKVIQHVFNGDITPLYHEDILREYKEVLSRKKFGLDYEVIQIIIDYFLKYGLSSERVQADVELPDEDDRIFYEVSLSRAGTFLITGNLSTIPTSHM